MIVPAAVVGLTASCGKSDPAIYGSAADPVRVELVCASGAAADAVADAWSGTLEAGASTTLSFAVPGTVTKVLVAEGDRVRQGQLIATVGSESLVNAAKIADATLGEARDAYARLKKLHDANALTDMKWVEVQEKLKQAEAAAAIAHKELRDANLYAPIAGLVSAKPVDAGQNVAPGMPVVELVDLATIKAKITVSERQMAAIPDDATATVSVGPSVSFKARLAEKGVTANPLSRNYTVTFVAPNPDGALRPGMICDVTLDAPTSAQASPKSADIILPPQAVVLNWDNSTAVWLSRGGTATRVPVTVGSVDSRGVVITQGLQPTDSVVVSGQQKLSEGQKIISVN
jgi:RND family efflux transporter MFP subunit